MSAWDIWPAKGSTMLSPAELAARLDEDLAAHAAGSCPHYRAKHASPPPDIHYPAGDRGRDGAAAITRTRRSRVVRASPRSPA